MVNSSPFRSVISSTVGLLASCAVILLGLGAPSHASAQVTTHHYDNSRTGAILSETTLTTSNVNVANFGKLFSLAVDGPVDAQPLYLPGVSIPLKGLHNVLYVATEHNSLYAFDADSPGSPLWQANMGTAVKGQDLIADIGVKSTPVIDAAAGTIYVVAESLEDNAATFTLHALDVTTGRDKVAPVLIQGKVAGKSSESSDGSLAFAPKDLYQRAGLLLVNGNVYIGFGSDQKNTAAHGWLFSYSAATLAQTGILCLSPDGGKSSVWQGGAAPAADASGSVFLQTGGGLFDINMGERDYGDNIVRVTTSASGLAVSDYFAPSTQWMDDLNNWDLGSSGPLLIPATPLGVAAGKAGKIYVFNTSDLGHFNSTNKVAQEWAATLPYSGQQGGGFWGSSYAYYNSTLFAFAERDSLKAFSFNGSQFNTNPTSQSTFALAPGSSSEPALSISANGLTSGSGIVWASFSADGVIDGKVRAGVVYAFDAADVSRVLWTSDDNSLRDAVGNGTKWNPPVVANGRMYLGTYDSTVNVYGLLSPVPNNTPINAAPVQVAANAVVPRAHLAAAVVPMTTANVALVQQAAGLNGGNGQNTLTVTLGAQPASGNTLVLFFGQVGSAQTITSISGATWNRVAQNFATNIGDSEVWVGTNPTSTSITVTGTNNFGGFQPGYATVAEFSGVSTTLDASPLNTTGSWPVTTGSLTTTSAGDLLLSSALSYNGGGAQATASSPWMLLNAAPGTYSLAAGYQVAAAAGTNVTTRNGYGSPQVATVILALKGTGSSGGISATAGTPQSATINTAFGTALQATVKDASNNPVSGATVTFTAPATGASGTFGGSATATAVTNVSGIATPPALTANGQTGSYTVTATAPGVGTSANFSLSNSAGAPASITATAGTPQSTTVSTVFATPLQVTVKDSSSNLLSGVTVTFTAPATGASATFAGSNTATALTNASGIATVSAPTAGAQAGTYTITATTAGVATPASFNLTNTAAVSGGGSSGGSVALVQQAAGLNGGNGQNTLTVTLGAQPGSGHTLVLFFGQVGSAQTITSISGATWNRVAQNFATNIGDSEVWVGTNPTSTSITVTGTNNFGGFQPGYATVAEFSGVSTTLDASPLNTTGSWPVTTGSLTTTSAGDLLLSSALSYNGGGAQATASSPWMLLNAAPGTYSLAAGYQVAAAAGTNVTTWNGYGSPQVATVILALKGTGSSGGISATAGTPQSATINTAFGTALQATVKDASNNPVSGATVTFTAPATGASGTFGGSATATAVTNVSGIATAPALTANGQSGSYTVTATAPGVSTSANFSLSNSAGAPASITATAGTPQSTTVSTVFATPLQVTVKDSSSNLLSGVTVTFTAPATGASATFGGSNTATALTNASGIATAPALTAKSATGSYTVTATVPGVGTSANFSLSNTAASPSSISTTAGTPQNATVNTAFGTALQATVKDVNNNALGGVTVTFTAPASGAGASFSGFSTATAVTNASGIATAPALTANGQVGSYTVTATAAGVGTSASFSLSNVAVISVGGIPALTGSGTSAAVTASLTSEGTSDWVHWGDSPLTRKAGVTPQISNYTVVGSGGISFYSNDPRALSWTDGTPTVTATNNNGIYINAVQNGFSFTAPADTGTRVLTVHVGGWLSGATLTAHLSDNSAADYVDVTTPAAGQYDRNYTLTYSVASAGQTLTVSWVTTSGGGNVTLNGVALAGGTAVAGNQTISATAGTPQSATINTAFGTALQATVKDASNNPVSGATVTFTAPATGASGTFGGSATATAVTNVSGIATAPALTANGQTGSYTVTATAPGVGTSANFSLSNSAGAPASITATAGTPQSTTVSTVFATPLQVTVKDSSSNLLSGVTVTFTAPATGASATFGGSNTATALTNASGIATVSAPTAGAQAGTYTITATTAGVATPASFNLTNTAAVSGGGSSGGSVALVQQAAGLNGGNGQNTLTVTLGAQPASGNTLVLFFGQVGSAQTITSISGATWNRVAQNFATNIGDSEVWVGTNPTSTSITVTGTNNFGGFQPGYATVAEFSGVSTTLDASPLNTTGSWPVTTGSLTTTSAGDLLLSSALSYNGGGAQATASSPWMLLNAAPGTYSLAAGYQVAAAAGTNVTTWNGYGSPQVATVILALKGTGSSGGISATAGTPQSATINTAFGTALQATVKDASNNPVSGATVTFTAPATGASGTFGGSATATAVTNVSGIATAPALTANGQTGPYTVTATAPGVGTSANFSLSNSAGAPASITATAGTPQTGTVSTIFVTPLQATVKDANGNALSGAAVTFTAPASGATATFSGSANASAITNASGIATAPSLTANGQAGSYSVTATTVGVSASANFSLTNSTAPPVPIRLVQQAQIDSMINIPSESVPFTSPNTAGNWIGVAIFGGQSNTHLFTVTDSNGNVYNRALTVGNTHDNITLGMYYAENIRAGANQIKVVPDTSGYIRIVIVEYSGVAIVNSLDVTVAAQGSSVTPSSGTVNTTANGDLLWGASASADAEPFAGPGYTLDALVPAAPGTALTTEDQIQTTAGPASSSLTFGSAKDWTMGLAAFRRAQ